MKTKKRLSSAIVTLAIIFAVVVGFCVQTDSPPNYDDATPAQKKILNYASAHGLSYFDYPQSLRELLERNPETEQFVLEYPIADHSAGTLMEAEYQNLSSIPLFLQWDARWGYIPYGSDVAGITACGPVCLSMVACYLTGDAAYSPDKMIRFATEQGYYVKGSGSSWTLISEGGPKLGFDVAELPLDEGRILQNLEAGNPIICVMGPGDFTTSGHFLVLTGTENGMLQINDPNSRMNSEKLWAYSQIKDQIRNLWVIRK